MSCTEEFATVADYVEIWRIGSVDGNDPDAIGEIELALSMANSDIIQALVAADACECTLPEATRIYLKKLVVIDAAVLFKASCGPSLTDALRETYLTWVTDQLEMIRTLVIDPCGDTGKDAPAVGFAQQSMKGINISDIIIHGNLRNQDG